MKDYKFPENWPAPKEYLVELGRLFALWGGLESSLILAISKLAGYEETMDWRAAVLTAHSSFMQRVDILATLCDELQSEFPHLSDYKKVVERIKSIQVQRNKYAHNSIILDENSGKVVTSSLKARGKLKTKIEEIKLDDLKQICADIHETMLDLHHLITQARYPPMWER
jgi:hypothetical protein